MAHGVYRACACIETVAAIACLTASQWSMTHVAGLITTGAEHSGTSSAQPKRNSHTHSAPTHTVVWTLCMVQLDQVMYPEYQVATTCITCARNACASLDWLWTVWVLCLGLCACGLTNQFHCGLTADSQCKFSPCADVVQGIGARLVLPEDPEHSQHAAQQHDQDAETDQGTDEAYDEEQAAEESRQAAVG